MPKPPQQYHFIFFQPEGCNPPCKTYEICRHEQCLPVYCNNDQKCGKDHKCLNGFCRDGHNCTAADGGECIKRER